MVVCLCPQFLKKLIQQVDGCMQATLMDLVQAIEVSKKFSHLRPKVFKGFDEWGVCDTETDGYVVLANSSVAKQTALDKLEDCVDRHNLKIEKVEGYMMICTPR